MPGRRLQAPVSCYRPAEPPAQTLDQRASGHGALLGLHIDDRFVRQIIDDETGCRNGTDQRGKIGKLLQPCTEPQARFLCLRILEGWRKYVLSGGS